MKTRHISENTSEYLSGGARIGVISRLRPLGFQQDRDLNNVAELALSMFDAGAVQLSLVHERESQILSSVGTLGTANVWMIEASSLAAPEPNCLVVLNAAEDVRFADIDAVTHTPGVRFIAVAPIRVSEECVGVLSVMSSEPRIEFGQVQQTQLMQLAGLAGSLLASRRDSRLGADAISTLHRDEDRARWRLKSAMSAAGSGICARARFTGNRMAYTMLGLSPDQQVSGEDVFRAMHADDFPAMKSAFTRALAQNQDYVGEFRAASSGQWLLGRGRIFERDAAGKPAVAVGVNIDITETKNAAEKTRLLLRELNHRVKNTLAMLQSLARQTLNRTSDPARVHGGVFRTFASDIRGSHFAVR